jgi:hypothetical protein
MDGAGRPREIPLKGKYRRKKPKGKYHADYDGNTGEHRAKHVLLPAVPGIKRKRFRRKYKQL